MTSDAQRLGVARWRRPARRAGPALVRLAELVLLVEVVAFCVTTLPGVRGEPGFHDVFDGLLQPAAYVTAALVCLPRVLHPNSHRLAWTLIASAVAARAAAFVIYLRFVRELDPRPYPSLADAFWLLSAGLLIAGLICLARDADRRVTGSLALDGLLGGLAAAAIGIGLLWETLAARVESGDSAVVATNLAYPVLDVVLALVLVGVLMAYAWSPPGAVWALAAAVAGFATLDAAFLVQVTAGTYRPGTALAALSLMATAAIALAAWIPDRSSERGKDDVPGLVFPGVFALACLGLLVYAALRPVPVICVGFAAAGIVIAIARTGLSFSAVRSVAEHRREARTDELTGLANRRAFNEKLEKALHGREDGRLLALLILDLDDFKTVNDSLGHHHGDELLVAVARRLERVLRADDLLCRVGGDEFAVLLEDTDRELATHVAERLRRGLRRPFHLAARDLDVAASIGIALYPDHGREPVELLQHADLAMYDAKSAHTGQTLFRPERHEATRARLESADRFRHAIADGEIVLHFQPQVSLDSGKVVGAEALVRWQHPQAGLMPPAAFLHQAENAGLMRMLTLHVIEQAARQGASWRARGLTVPIAVNLSVTDLLDVDFPQQVGELLAGSGLPGGMLELELTEDLFMADPARARKVITALLETGVTLAVDDYGTGYSSLAYLRDLHEIRGLKLDRSFVTHLDVDARACAIVESTVTLARSLDLRVVAEGVETSAVRDRLADLGCELAQGFLFSKAVPADVIELGVIESGRAATRSHPRPMR